MKFKKYSERKLLNEAADQLTAAEKSLIKAINSGTDHAEYLGGHKMAITVGDEFPIIVQVLGYQNEVEHGGSATNEAAGDKDKIQKLMDELWALREKHENDATTNEIGWIDDSLDLVKIGYLKEKADSDHQYELENEGTSLTYEEAKAELETRIKNFKDSLGVNEAAGDESGEGNCNLIDPSGKVVFTGDENACWVKLQNSQSQSGHWATKHGGWKIEPVKMTNEADGDAAMTDVAPEDMAAFEKELEKALKAVMQEVPADLKKIADGGEIDLAPKLGAEAQKELNEAIGLLVGGGLALPAITQILGKSIAWAGGKIGSGDMKQFGEKTQELGDKLHHKYEHVLDKMLSPFTKNMDEKKRHIVNKVVFYSILAVVGGVGIGGAVHAAGAGSTALAAAEGGLSAIKATEIAAGAAELLPAILSKIIQSA